MNDRYRHCSPGLKRSGDALSGRRVSGRPRESPSPGAASAKPLVEADDCQAGGRKAVVEDGPGRCSPSPASAVARSSIIGLWPMTSTEPLGRHCCGSATDSRPRRRCRAGRRTARGRCRLCPAMPSSVSRARTGVGAQRDVGHVVVVAHGRRRSLRHRHGRTASSGRSKSRTPGRAQPAFA